MEPLVAEAVIPVLQADQLEFRAFAAFLALIGIPSAIWPVKFNKPFARGILERFVWDDPGLITKWVVRIASIYWVLVWGWLAIFVTAPPYFPT